MTNIILTNISKLGTSPFHNYRTDDMGVVRGKYTNEAPVKYLVNSICKESPDAECKILAITMTSESEEAYVPFKMTMKRYCRRNGYGSVTIENVGSASGSFGFVIDKIISKTKRGDKVFLDTTGGFRDSVYFLMTVVRMLEFSGIRLEKAVYSFLNRENNKDNKIVNITETYNIFNLINAANSFMSFGNSDELAVYFADSDNDDIKHIIDVMNRFSDEVALCRTSKLESLMTELNEMLQKLEELSTDVQHEMLFKSILGVIKEKFGKVDDKALDYDDIIIWCLDNKMIQQAVTILVEKMPEYILKSGMIKYNPDGSAAGYDEHFDDHYNKLYNSFMKQTTKYTYSPYPFANLLMRLRSEDPYVFKQVYESRSIQNIDFKEPLSEDERRGIINLIRVKNAVFTDNTHRRSAEDIEKQKMNEKLRAFADSDIFETGATKTKSFVNEVLKSDDYMRMLQGSYIERDPKVWGIQDIDVIEHLEDVVTENNRQCRIGNGRSVEDVRRVLRTLIFMKRFVRNALNHANEDNHVSEEYSEYFGSKGYNVDSELSVEEIESVIRDFIQLVRGVSA